MNMFRTLRADEIECRVGTCNERGFTLLLYKDARCDQNVLDETVGPGNWQRDHKEVKGNLYCGVAIWDGDKKQWIWKWDCGVESNTEKEKGEASDSFKRACFNWGIGRELYTAPFIYVKGNTQKNEKGKCAPTFRTITVEHIAYDNGKIVQLSILGDGEKIYTLGGSTQARTQAKPTLRTTSKTGATMSLDEAYAMTTAKGTPYNKLSNDNLQYIIDHTSNEKYKTAARMIIEDRERNDDLQSIEAPIVEEGLPF